MLTAIAIMHSQPWVKQVSHEHHLYQPYLVCDPMNFNELKEFITNKMLMQHVYQPVMIKTLLESGNIALRNRTTPLLKYIKEFGFFTLTRE